MTSKARAIRKYQASFGMTRQEAETYYEKRQAQDAAQPKVKLNLYYSTALKQYVTVPDEIE